MARHKFTLNRRTMLRGIAGGSAVFIGLPPLEAMLNSHGEAYAGGEALAKRFITFMWGNGVKLPRFEPATVGADYELSEELLPFSNVRDYLTVCTGINNRCDLTNFIGHHEGLTAFNGYTYIPRPDIPGFSSDWAGPTADQIIADSIQANTPTTVKSIQLQISKWMSPVDNGTTAEVLSVAGTPGNLVTLPPEPNPIAVWNTIFGEFVAPTGDSDLRLSILDFVRDDAARIRSNLGTIDNQRVDAHLQGIFELEQKIAALPPACAIPGAPTESNSGINGQENFTDVTQAMSDLIAMAFQCDVTRVASILFLGVAGESIFGELNHTDTQHNNSHNDDEFYHEGVTHTMGRIAQLMQTLVDTPDPTGGNLMDSTILYASSDVAVGTSHLVRRQPLIIAGHGRGHLVHPGIHYQAIAAADPEHELAPTSGNLSDALLACMQAFDPTITSVGEGLPYSDAPLADILA